jgi:hypothetical protein
LLGIGKLAVEPSYVDVKTPHRFARSPLMRPRSP